MVQKKVSTALFALVFAAGAFAGSLDVGTLQKAIDAAGAHWTAGQSWVSDLEPERRGELFGNPSVVERWISADPDRTVEERGEDTGFPEGGRAYLDWRDHNGYNWVTPVKNQLNCGACVAFGTVAAFECQVRISSQDPGYPIDLSEQHLFSCGGGSCTGGWQITPAFNRCLNPGVPDEECLPYTARDSNCSQACPDWQTRAIRIQDWEDLGGWFWPPSVEIIQNAVNRGPVTCSMIVYTDFMYYSGGVYRHVSGDIEGGHCVCIVGYDDANSCWIVKNSWGRAWGEEGFFRIQYGDSSIGLDSSRMIITVIPPTSTPAPHTPTPVPSSTAVFTATPIPSWTPDPGQPTPTPQFPAPTQTPFPTAPPETAYIRILLNQTVFHPGDLMVLSLEIGNPDEIYIAQLFLALDIQGWFWFWPTWSPEPDWKEIAMPGYGSACLDIMSFNWPALNGSIVGAGFWATVVSDGALSAGYDYIPFKYSPF